MSFYFFKSVFHKLKFFVSSKRELKNNCFANQTNLYFNFNGSVTCCSHNKNQIFGNYPKNTIEDIINGKNRQQAIKNFEKGLIPSGCEECYEKLKNNNSKAALFQIYNKTFRKSHIPYSAEFELSNKCNLECIMCSETFSTKFYKDNDKKFISVYNDNFVEELSSIIPFLKRTNFKGGEPFLIDIYIDIWEKCIELNPKMVISVTTNGTILNSKIKDILSRAKFDINVSIDALEKAKYEEIRKNASFEVFYKNLNFFIEYCKNNNSNFTACTCLMANNYCQIPEIFNFALEKRFNVFINYVIQPEHLSIRNLPKDKILSIIEFIQNNRPNFNRYRDRENLETYNAMILQLEIWQAEEENLTERATINEQINILFDTISYENLIEKLKISALKYYGIENNSVKNENYDKQVEKFSSFFEIVSKHSKAQKIVDTLISFDEETIYKLFEFTEEKLADFVIEKVKDA